MQWPAENQSDDLFSVPFLTASYAAACSNIQFRATTWVSHVVALRSQIRRRTHSLCIVMWGQQVHQLLITDGKEGNPFKNTETFLEIEVVAAVITAHVSDRGSSRVPVLNVSSFFLSLRSLSQRCRDPLASKAAVVNMLDLPPLLQSTSFALTSWRAFLYSLNLAFRG